MFEKQGPSISYFAMVRHLSFLGPRVPELFGVAYQNHYDRILLPDFYHIGLLCYQQFYNPPVFAYKEIWAFCFRHAVCHCIFILAQGIGCSANEPALFPATNDN
jgi:hypothetical protein